MHIKNVYKENRCNKLEFTFNRPYYSKFKLGSNLFLSNYFKGTNVLKLMSTKKYILKTRTLGWLKVSNWDIFEHRSPKFPCKTSSILYMMFSWFSWWLFLKYQIPLENKYQRKIPRTNLNSCFENDRGIQRFILTIIPVRVVVA